MHIELDHVGSPWMFFDLLATRGTIMAFEDKNQNI